MDREDSVSGAVRVAADPLDATIEFLERLGFRLEEIAPADDPAEALMTGHGLRLRLDRAHRGATELLFSAGGTLTPGRHVGPIGLVVEVAAGRELYTPPAAPVFVHTRLADTPFHPGRAGLLYRDLLPSRLGGRWIASHIRVARGGPVDDRVHHHRVRLQLIHCVSGEAELVYQGQGPAFAFRAGDLVLQPPGLRHRVLAASAGFEVVELASPAWHPTLIDHELLLPSPERVLDRAREGQRFLHAVGDRCPPQPLSPGVTARDLGLQSATGGLATARTLRFDGPGSVEVRASDDLRFLFVSAGTGAVDGPPGAALAPGDAVALPPGPFVLTGSPGFQVLEVTSPAGVPTSATDC
jgi:mannose-6-phosphate isomerase-like protein (cupin superfamily)